MLVEADIDGITDTPLASWLTRHGHIVKLPLTKEKRLTAYETFRILDLDGSGRMDVDELQHAFKGLGVNLSKKQVAQLVKEVDRTGDRSVGPEEFLQLLHHNQHLFGNTISIQMLAAAHRRQENMAKLLNRRPNQHISDNEFKLPPLAGLPKRRAKGGAKPSIPHLLLENQFAQLMRRDSLDDLMDSFDLDDGEDSPLLKMVKRGGDSPPSIRPQTEIASELRGFGMDLEDDLSPVKKSLAALATPTRDSRDLLRLPSDLRLTLEKKKVIDANKLIEGLEVKRGVGSDGTMFLSRQVRGQRVRLRGTHKTTISAPVKAMMVKDPDRFIKAKMSYGMRASSSFA